jgi:hypothetical protein
MRFWRGASGGLPRHRFARRGVAIAALVLAQAVPSSARAPALAQTLSEPQFPGTILLRSFTNSAGFKIEFRAWSDRFGAPDVARAPLQLCVTASRSKRVGAHTREVAFESGCSFDFARSHWDQMSWSGWISGDVRTLKSVETITRRTDGEWTVVSSAQRKSRTRVDLEWEPVGDMRPEVYAMPFICYAGPPFGPVCLAWSMRWIRAARFVGAFKFEGFSMSTKLDPDGHPGRVWLGSP